MANASLWFLKEPFDTLEKMFLVFNNNVIIVWNPPPLIYLPRREGEEILKILKRGGSMVEGQVFLKKGGLALLQFDFFKVYHLHIQKLLYSLQNYVIHLKKKNFSATIILGKKDSQGARLWTCTYRAPKTSIRYTKKHAPKINRAVCFTNIL